MKKSMPAGTDYDDTAFKVAVSWDDRYSNRSKLQASFSLGISNTAGAVQVVTEQPLVIDGNTGKVISGGVTMNDVTPELVDVIQAANDRPGINFAIAIELSMSAFPKEPLSDTTHFNCTIGQRSNFKTLIF